MYASDMTLTIGSLAEVDGCKMADAMVVEFRDKVEGERMTDESRAILRRVMNRQIATAGQRFLQGDQLAQREAFFAVYAARFEAAFMRRFEAEWNRLASEAGA